MGLTVLILYYRLLKRLNQGLDIRCLMPALFSLRSPFGVVIEKDEIPSWHYRTFSSVHCLLQFSADFQSNLMLSRPILIASHTLQGPLVIWTSPKSLLMGILEWRSPGQWSEEEETLLNDLASRHQIWQFSEGGPKRDTPRVASATFTPGPHLRVRVYGVSLSDRKVVMFWIWCRLTGEDSSYLDVSALPHCRLAVVSVAPEVGVAMSLAEVLVALREKG